MRSAINACLLAGTVCFFVAADELGYRFQHSHRPGPSLSIALIAVSTSVVAFCVAWLFADLQAQQRKAPPNR